MIFPFSHLFWIRHFLSHNGAWLALAKEIHGENFLSNLTDQLSTSIFLKLTHAWAETRCDVTLRPVDTKHVPKIVTKVPLTKCVKSSLVCLRMIVIKQKKHSPDAYTLEAVGFLVICFVAFWDRFLCFNKHYRLWTRNITEKFQLKNRSIGWIA